MPTTMGSSGANCGAFVIGSHDTTLGRTLLFLCRIGFLDRPFRRRREWGRCGMAAEERVLGGVATKVLMENDKVRIWEMRLGPGEDSAIHRHDLDYILVQIDGDRIAGVPEPDTQGEYNEYIEADVTPGNAIFIKKGGIELARNTA